MPEKNELRVQDYSLIREKMRGILESGDSHPRDKIQAGRLLRQINDDEVNEPLVRPNDPFTFEIDDVEFSQRLRLP